MKGSVKSYYLKKIRIIKNFDETDRALIFDYLERYSLQHSDYIEVYRCH